VVLGGKETVLAHEKAGNTSNKRAATGGTLAEASPKKTQEHHDRLVMVLAVMVLLSLFGDASTDFYSKVQASAVESRQNP
jgi:hypothetical protein